MPYTRVSLLAITIDGSPADIRLDTSSGSEPIVRFGPAGISLHCAGSPETLLAAAEALTKAARLKERRSWIRGLPEVS